MARRRGLGNAERVALDLKNVTATGAVVAAPCFVYSLDVMLSDQTVSGKLSIGDTTAASDLVLESTRLDFKLSEGAASALCDRVQRNFFPPLFIANQLFFANSTGINSVSVSYLAAS